ncbi:MAG: Mur ligase family protein [Elusimicrobiota bacterium]
MADTKDKVHFVGIGGCGMSALAQFHAMGGGEASGSDRLLDRGQIADLRERLEALGVRLVAQDGSGIDSGTREVVASTAVEDSNRDVARARELGIPVVLRADALARHVAGHRTLAVAGTSGKSTVTAMAYEILEVGGLGPSLITGAPLNRLVDKGLIGNAFRGDSDLLVAEADESDGMLPKYEPWIGLLLNLGKDHKEVSEIRDMFLKLRSRSRRFVVNADAANLAELREGSVSFGFSGGSVRGRDLKTGPRGSTFSVDGVRFEVPLPGRHNAENALAAAAACIEAGVALETAAGALARYRGVARRFEAVGTSDGVEVIDDYAHNPDKVKAALAAAHLRAGRVLAVYQPHGFGPTRFLKAEFIEAFAAALGPSDVLWLSEIYYAGGTAVRDITSDDIAAPLRSRGVDARYAPDREAVAGEIARAARPGDVVLVLGARDPTLGAYARRILEALRRRCWRPEEGREASPTRSAP